MTLSDAPPPTPVDETTALTSVAIGRLLRARAGTDDLTIVRRCHDLTGGDPGLLQIVLDAVSPDPCTIDLPTLDGLEERPPPAVVSSIERRRGELSPPAAAVAEAAAIAGALSTVSRLSALSDLPKGDTRLAVTELVTAGLLQSDTTPVYRARLEAAAVRHRMDEERRRELHRRLAVVLHERGGGGDLDIAHHLHGAGTTGEQWAGPTLLRAARQVSRAGEHRRAVTWLRHAFDEPLGEDDRCRVLDALAGAELALGDPTAVGRLRALADRTGGVEHRLRLARALISQASPCEAVAELDSMLETTADPALRRRITLQLITAARQDLDLRARSHALAADLTDELRADVDADAGSLAEVAYEHVLAGTPVDVVLELARRALDGARRARLGAHHAQALFVTLLTAGDHAGAQRLNRLREQAGDAPTVQLNRRASLALGAGSAAEAAELAAGALACSVDIPIMRPSSVALLARCLVRLGRLDEAAETLAPMLTDRSLSTLVTYHPVLLARAELGRARQDWEEALLAAEECADFSARMGTENPVVVPWHPVAAEALAALGRGDDAVRLASDALVRIERFGYAPAELRTALEELARGTARPPVTPLPRTMIRVLGDGAVERGRTLVPLGEDLVDRALRYLAVHERPVLREQLVEALWPDSDPAAGRHRLRKLLSRLRARHGQLVVSHGSQLSLAPDVEVDLRRFRQLARAAHTATDPDVAIRTGRAALELARGEVCPLDRYDDWALDVEVDHRREREQVSALVDGLTAVRRADPSRSRQPPAAPT